jgi:hypothetical protein
VPGTKDGGIIPYSFVYQWMFALIAVLQELNEPVFSGQLRWFPGHGNEETG